MTAIKIYSEFSLIPFISDLEKTMLFLSKGDINFHYTGCIIITGIYLSRKQQQRGNRAEKPKVAGSVAFCLVWMMFLKILDSIFKVRLFDINIRISGFSEFLWYANTASIPRGTSSRSFRSWADWSPPSAVLRPHWPRASSPEPGAAGKE